MFKNLFDFAYQRSRKEAFGFYLVFFLIVVSVTMIAGPHVLPNTLSETEMMTLMQEFQASGTIPPALDEYLRVISFYSAIFSLSVTTALALLVTMKKNIFRQPKILAAVIAIIIAAYLLGPIISLMGIAWLTTKPDQSAPRRAAGPQS